MKIIDGWVDTAKEYNLMQNSMSRAGLPLTHLVIHGTAGGSDAYSIAKYMEGAGVSTHFVISTDGTIVQCVQLSVAAWANAPLNAPRIAFKYAGYNPNLWSCSIEFAKPDTTNGIDITAAQRASGFALIKLICETYGIPKRRGDGNGGIISHADINSVDRSRCPGTFPWDEMLASINGGSTVASGGEEELSIDINSPLVKNYFTEVGGNWKCRNGNVLMGGMLGYYKRNNGLLSLGLPLTGEIVVSSKPYATIQVFERGILAYDPNHVLDNPPGSGDVYRCHIDTPKFNPFIKAVQDKLDAANKTIADLTAKLAQATGAVINQAALDALAAIKNIVSKF